MNRRRPSHKAGKTSAIRATITSITHGGFGVAHTEVKGERRAIFVDRTAPEDEIDLAVDFSSRPARGTVVRLEKVLGLLLFGDHRRILTVRSRAVPRRERHYVLVRPICAQLVVQQARPNAVGRHTAAARIRGL